MRSMILKLSVILLASTSASAADTPPRETIPSGLTVTKLDVDPPQIELTSPFSYRQLLISAHLSDGSTIDATRIARIQAKPFLSIGETGLVRPQADGSGEITITLGNQSKSIGAQVRNSQRVPDVSFVRDVQPALSKMGCNAGTCHGAQAGKNGFKLSLRGYDPIYDFRALTDDLEGRRFNRAAPDRSLMLMKPAGAVPHAGGVTMQAGDPNYRMIEAWIAQGVKLDLNVPRVKSIALKPVNPTVQRIGERLQIAVMATYSDGSQRDVTAETFVESSNTETLTVDKTGIATTLRRGEATLLARYEGAYAATTVVVMGDRSGFAWKQQPVLNRIDELVDDKLKAMKIMASDLCDDATFLRRVSLDLTGLPPTSDAVRAFLADSRPSQVKRNELIDKLIGSDGYVDYWTNKWGDLLQVNRKFLGDPGAKALRGWIRDAVKSNMPYNQFAYAMLTGTGSTVTAPPASYYKVLRSPDAVMENTTQLFLAIRFNCNKCHDHPFERWTQDQYFQLAAYFAQVERKEDPKYKGQKLGGTAVEKPLPLVEIIADTKEGDIKHDRTGFVAPPKFPYEFVSASVKETKDTESRRVVVAKWITAKENPYFARSFVNRMWSYLTGVGIIEPVDDIRAGNPPTNPALLDYLTEQFVESNFDVRKLVAMICKSRTYQLSIVTNRWNRDDEVNYSHAIARRLPAEVLFDSVHAATGSVSKLPGLPPGSRAAQLIDSTVDLPGGFLDLFGKPVRESACECERSSGMMLGPVLAMVSGPVIGDAVQDQASRIAQFTMKEKDNGKVVEEIYLSVLGRMPSDAERRAGVAALTSTKADYDQLMAEYQKKKDAFDAYRRDLDSKQAQWETGLRNQKPTAWTTVDLKSANSKLGQNPGNSKESSTLTIQSDGSILVSGKNDVADLYTIVGQVKLDGVITAVRLEALSDPKLPGKGPGRAANGNFVLSEFKANQKPLKSQGDAAKPKPVKFVNPEATYSQEGFPIANTIDNNNATGWAIAPETGRDHLAMFRVQGGPNAKDGVQFTFTFEQRYGQNHTLGKFRLSVTTDPKPRLSSPVSAELAKMIDTPVAERTDAQKTELRNRYLAQDIVYKQLQAEAAKVPPGDPRVLGSQDLLWALLNSPAFLFNR